jgi:hypothetical protein
MRPSLDEGAHERVSAEGGASFGETGNGRLIVVLGQP